MTGESSKPRSSREKPSGDRTAASSKGSARQTMGAVANEVFDREFLEQLAREITEMKGLVRVYCPKCRQSLMAETKDYTKILQAIREMLEQAEGRPSGEEAGGLTLVVERPAYASGG